MARTDRALGVGLVLSALAPAALAPVAFGQALDLSHGGPVNVTAAGGIDWNQAAQTVTAHGDARATRGDVTVTADQLIAHYRKKPGNPAKLTPAAAIAPAPIIPAPATPDPAAAPPANPPPANPPAVNPKVTGMPDDSGGNEIYRLEADRQVHIFTQTDQAWGDHAIYDIDQAVLVLTGHALRLTTPTDVLTARDSMEYWSQKHMAVGRGDATVTTNDGRRIAADTLVGYTVPNGPPNAPGAKPAPPPKPNRSTDPLAASGKLQRVEAYGHVQVRTATEIVNGDRGVYVPDTGLARVVGHVHITRGDNQLNGAAAIVNMKTGVATMMQSPGARVQGLVVPNDPQSAGVTQPGKPKKPAKTAKGHL